MLSAAAAAALPACLQRGALVGPPDCAMCLRGHVPAPARSGSGSPAAVDPAQLDATQPVSLQAPAVRLAQPVRRFLQQLGGQYTGAQDWPLKCVKVPLQRSPYDGALFVCTSILYLLAGLPPLLTAQAADVAAAYRRTQIDIFHGTDCCYPGGRARLCVLPAERCFATCMRSSCAAWLLPRCCRLPDAAVVPSRDGRGAARHAADVSAAQHGASLTTPAFPAGGAAARRCRL